MVSDDCIFSKVVSGEISVQKVYEDDVVLAFLDINPVSDGHTLVIPKERFKRLEDCPADLLGQVCSRLGKIAKAVISAMDSDGYNLLCNNGEAAGQVVDYLHFHIIPRNSNDGIFHHWPSYKYSDEKVKTIADKIRKNL